VTVILQAVLSCMLVQWEMRKKLVFASAQTSTPGVPAL
jgi:hypothetical protein